MYKLEMAKDPLAEKPNRNDVAARPLVYGEGKTRLVTGEMDSDQMTP